MSSTLVKEAGIIASKETGRKVKTFNTLGSNKKEFYSDAKTWGALQEDLKACDIAFEGMKVVVGASQVTLEFPEAELPGGDFMLFLLPQKVKSGNCREVTPEAKAVATNTADGSFRSAVSSAISIIETQLGVLKASLAEVGTPAPVTEDPELAELAAQAAKLANQMKNIR